MVDFRRRGAPDLRVEDQSDDQRPRVGGTGSPSASASATSQPPPHRDPHDQPRPAGEKCAQHSSPGGPAGARADEVVQPVVVATRSGFKNRVGKPGSTKPSCAACSADDEQTSDDETAIRFRHMAADENRAEGVVDLFGESGGVVHGQLQMFRRCTTTTKGRAADKSGTTMMAPWFSQAAPAIARRGKVANHSPTLAATRSAKSRSSVIKMACAKSSCSAWDKRSIAVQVVVPVGDNQHLGRTGDGMDADAAVDLPLGLGDISVAGPDDLIDLGTVAVPWGQQTGAARRRG